MNGVTPLPSYSVFLLVGDALEEAVDLLGLLGVGCREAGGVCGVRLGGVIPDRVKYHEHGGTENER